jgi:hypothetical protein
MKESSKRNRLLASILGVLVGGFLGGACGLAIAYLASKSGGPTPLGAPGAGLIVIYTLPLGLILGAALGLIVALTLSGRYAERLRFRVLGTLLLLVVTAFALGAWRSHRTASDQAERFLNQYSADQVVQIVGEFVEKEGRWPKSWSDLRQVENSWSEIRRTAMNGYQWNEMQRRIFIDFEVDPRKLPTVDPMSFDAIRPTGPFEEYRNWGHVEALLLAIRKMQPKSE